MTDNQGQVAIKHQSSASDLLWSAYAIILGLSELFKNQGPDALFSVDGANGIGILLNEVALKTERVIEILEEKET